MLKYINKMFAKTSNKVLNLSYDSSELCALLEYKPIDLKSKDLLEFLLKLRKKHLINEIIVTDLNGVVIGSTTKNLKEGFKSAAIYNYINTEVKALSIILIEANGWQIIFKNDEKIYFLKANDSLAKLEVVAIVEEIENFINSMI